MINTYRNAIVIALACLAFVGIVAAVKSQETSPSPDVTVMPMTVAKDELKTDPSFFSASAVNSLEASSSPAVVGKPLDTIQATDTISAEAYLVGNVETGQIYLEHGGDKILPIASMSKLITAIAATDTFSPTTTIKITDADTAVPPDGSNLTAGETFTLKELLYPLLLDSSNVAAEAIASAVDRSKFLDLMRGYAWEIGMSGKSFFADPTGITPKNAASAGDIFTLAKYLYKYRPDILALTRVPSIETATTTDHGSHDFVSIHPFINDPAFIGGKTGHTPQAGDTMLTIMKVKDQPIAFIVLGARSDGRADDTRILLAEVQDVLK